MNDYVVLNNITHKNGLEYSCMICLDNNEKRESIYKIKDNEYDIHKICLNRYISGNTDICVLCKDFFRSIDRLSIKDNLKEECKKMNEYNSDNVKERKKYNACISSCVVANCIIMILLLYTLSDIVLDQL